MSSLRTTGSASPSQAAEAFVLSRTQTVVVALFACLPLPLLSVGATVLPFIELVERVAANFIPFATLGLEDTREGVFRVSGVAMQRLDVRSSEQPKVGAIAAESAGAPSTPASTTGGAGDRQGVAVSERTNDRSGSPTTPASPDATGSAPSGDTPASHPAPPPAEPGVDDTAHDTGGTGPAGPGSDPSPTGGAKDGSQGGSASVPTKPGNGDTDHGTGGVPSQGTGPATETPGNGGLPDGAVPGDRAPDPATPPAAPPAAPPANPPGAPAPPGGAPAEPAGSGGGGSTGPP